MSVGGRLRDASEERVVSLVARQVDDLREELERFGVGSLRKAAVDGNEKEGCYIAGQIAGLVKREQTAAEIIEEIMAETEQVLKNAANFLV